jgi:GH24 family phage-related lysozyme (muramidase)
MYEHRGASTLRINDGFNDQQIKYRGKIKFNDDETAIESMSRRGYIKYTTNDKELNAELNKQGQIEYELYDDGAKVSINDVAGKKILAEAIKEIIAMGFDSRGRLERIYKKGGNQAVLSEIDNLKQDYLKALYIDFLLNQPDITREQVHILIKKIGNSVGADYEKSKLLKDLTPYAKDSLTAQAYMEAVKSIQADHEKTSVLEKLIKQSLTADMFNEILSIAGSLGGDFEKSNILQKLIENGSLEQPAFVKLVGIIDNMGADFEKAKLLTKLSPQITDSLTAQTYLDAVKNMDADFERKNILENLLKQPLKVNLFNEMLPIVTDLGSDFEKANIINRMIDKGTMEQGSFDKLMDVIHNMGADHEQINLLKKLAEKDRQSEEEWISLINEAGHLDGDFDKANLMIHLSKRMPHTDPVRTAYIKVAKTINSETEYGKVMKAAD